MKRKANLETNEGSIAGESLLTEQEPLTWSKEAQKGIVLTTVFVDVEVHKVFVTKV